jgi:tetratricopeptide (TPR) repeat protein
LANDEQDCFQGKDPRLRIKVCSEIIRRAPHDATAYHHRAVSHAMAGDIDSAIRDYTTVIEIAPNNASAFDNRGRAYASKGDYAQATADLTKASELMAKANAQPINRSHDISGSEEGGNRSHSRSTEDKAEDDRRRRHQLVDLALGQRPKPGERQELQTLKLVRACCFPNQPV